MRTLTEDDVNAAEHFVAGITSDIENGASNFESVLNDVDSWKYEDHGGDVSDIVDALRSVLRDLEEISELDTSDLPGSGDYCADPGGLIDSINELGHTAVWLIAERDHAIASNGAGGAYKYAVEWLMGERDYQYRCLPARFAQARAEAKNEVRAEIQRVLFPPEPEKFELNFAPPVHVPGAAIPLPDNG